jgi:hypothetical protein
MHSILGGRAAGTSGNDGQGCSESKPGNLLQHPKLLYRPPTHHPFHPTPPANNATSTRSSGKTLPPLISISKLPHLTTHTSPRPPAISASSAPPANSQQPTPSPSAAPSIHQAAPRNSLKPSPPNLRMILSQRARSRRLRRCACNSPPWHRGHLRPLHRSKVDQ